MLLALLPSNGLGGFPWRLPFELIVCCAGGLLVCVIWVNVDGTAVGLDVP